jgi:hypothetical protein
MTINKLSIINLTTASASLGDIVTMTATNVNGSLTAFGDDSITILLYYIIIYTTIQSRQASTITIVDDTYVLQTEDTSVNLCHLWWQVHPTSILYLSLVSISNWCEMGALRLHIRNGGGRL